MSHEFHSLRAQFEAEASKPRRTNRKPKKSWVATPFTQMSITTSQSKSPSINVPNTTNSNPKPPLPPIDTVYVGDHIELTNGRLGIARYIGNIDVKKGIWIGVELDEPSGNHDGKLKNKQYFKTAPNHATFVKHKKIKRIIKQRKKQRKSRPPPIHVESTDEIISVIDQEDRVDTVTVKNNQKNRKRKRRKRSYFDSDREERKSDDDMNNVNSINMDEDIGIDINIQDIDSYNNDVNIPPTPHMSNSELISPPPIPHQSDDSSDYISEQESGIDVDHDTADFDTESFNNIKEKLRRSLNKTCLDTLNESQIYDKLLKEKKRYNKSKERLRIYIEGLLQYTSNMLNNVAPNNSDLAAALDPPFNGLPDKILNIDMYKYGHLCFFVTLKYIEILSFLEAIVWIPLQYIAMILPSAIGIRLLFEMPQKIHIFPPLYINRVCKRVVEGSQFPIAVCLKIAQFTNIVAEKSTTYVNQYGILHEYYTNIALGILNDINSDHAALIVLECATDLEPTTEAPLDCLTIAIRSNNGTFISNNRVMAILNGMWESSSFLEASNVKGYDHFTTYDNVNFLVLLRKHYRSFPAMPCGKYAIQLMLFICEVVFLSWFGIRRLTISSAFEFYEPILWAFGLSSAAETIYMTLHNDRLFRMNMADLSSLLLGFNFGVLAGIRFYYLLDVPSVATKQSMIYQDLVLTFETIYAFTLILAFLRVATLLSMNKRFGSLLIIVKRMAHDIENFALLWVLFVFGYVFAEYYYIAPYLDASFSDTFLGIFAVTTGGDPDFDELSTSDELSRSRSAIAQVMLAVLVLFGALLLINLFIAMMAKTFDELSNKSNIQWSLNTATFIVKYDRRNDILPPPFNLVVYILVLLWYIVEIPLVVCVGINPVGTIDFSSKTLSFKQKVHALIFGQHKVWICEYCHSTQPIQPDEQRVKMIKKWMGLIGLDTRDRTVVLSTEAVLCHYCKRVKRTEKRYEWVADNISYYIAYMVILPIILILAGPTGSIRILWQRLVDIERNDMEEFYQLFHEKQQQRTEITVHKMRKLFAQKRISEMLDIKTD